MGELAPQFLDRRLQKLKSLIDEMRSPVVEKSAVKFRESLPVETADESRVTMDFDH